MKRFILISLLTLATSGVISQPGPFGGYLKFRVFENGKLITPENKNFKVIPQYTKEKVHYQDTFQNKFLFVDGQFYIFPSIRTPVGGIVPKDFEVLIIKGSFDTMKITPPSFSYDVIRLDTIPYQKGSYQMEKKWYLASAVEVLNNGRIYPYTFNDFALINRNKLPIILPEKLLSADMNSVFFDTTFAKNNTTLSYEDSIIDNKFYTFIFHTASERKPVPILKFPTKSKFRFTQGDSLTFVYTTGDDSPIYVATDKSYRNWKIFFIEDFASKTKASGNIYPFYLKEIRHENGKFIATGARQFGHGASYQYLPGLYRLHLNVVRDSELYNKLKEEGLKQISQYIDTY